MVKSSTPLVSKEALQKATETLKHLTAHWSGGVCQGTVLHLDGSTAHGVVPHTACHSWVGSAYSIFCTGTLRYSAPYRADAKNFMVLSCHSKKKSKSICTPEAHEAIIMWIAKDSPFSEFVLNKDDDDSLKNGGVVLLCGPDGLTVAQTMWICKVLRYSTEGGKALDVWYSLVKNGVDPMLALLVCSFANHIHGATFGAGTVNGHVNVMTYADRMPNVPSLLLRKDDPFADSTQTLWSGTANVILPPEVAPKRITDKIAGFCKPVRKSDGWGGTVEGKGADEKDFISRILKWQEELSEHLPEGWATTVKPVNVVGNLPSSSTVYLDLDL